MRSSIIIVGALCLAAPVSYAQEEAEREIRRVEERAERREAELEERIEILEGLAAGMEALKRLGRERELEMLRAVAREIGKERPRGGDAELIERRLRALRVSFGAFEGQKGEQFARFRDVIEHGIHAREIMLEGAWDADAKRVLRNQPKAEQLIELLMHSDKFLRERKRKEQAAFVRQVAREWLGSLRNEHALHALEFAEQSLEGARDKRNRHIRELLGARMDQLRAGHEWNRDETGQVLEMLHHCEDRLREQRKADAADIVHRYREQLHTRWKKGRERDQLAARVERLEDRVNRIADLLERLVDQLEEEDD